MIEALGGDWEASALPGAREMLAGVPWVAAQRAASGSQIKRLAQAPTAAGSM